MKYLAFGDSIRVTQIDQLDVRPTSILPSFLFDGAFVPLGGPSPSAAFKMPLMSAAAVMPVILSTAAIMMPVVPAAALMPISTAAAAAAAAIPVPSARPVIIAVPAFVSCVKCLEVLVNKGA